MNLDMFQYKSAPPVGALIGPIWSDLLTTCCRREGRLFN